MDWALVVPFNRDLEPLSETMGWFIAEKPVRLGDIGEAMADVTWTERAVDGFGAVKVRKVRREQSRRDRDDKETSAGRAIA